MPVGISERQKNAGYLLPENVTGHPMICVSFQIPDAPEYRAAVRGHLAQLGKWWTWERSGASDDRRATQTAQIFRTLMEETLAFNDECFPDLSGCVEHAPSSTIIEYAPNDPFRTPDLVPDGYAFPPWYRATNTTSVTLGTSLGDVVTDVTRTQSIPVLPPASGYPRFRVHLNGTGTVELHLVKLNSGGYAQITTDDDVLSVEFLSLAKDVISIPPERSDDVIIERVIETPGTHHIDVLFIPLVNDELPYIGQGGALRKVVLCGFDEMIRNPEFQSITDAKGCNQLQWKYTDEENWTNLGVPICPGDDGSDGSDGLDGAPGAPGQDGVCPDCDGGVTLPEPTPEQIPAGQDARCLSAAAMEQTIYDVMKKAADETSLGISAAGVAAALLGVVAIFFPPVAFAALGIGLGAAAGNFAANGGMSLITQSVRDELLCILYCYIGADGRLSEQEFTGLMTELDDKATNPINVAWEFIKNTVFALQPEILNNAARLVPVQSADCSACDTCDEWEHTFDFLVSSHGTYFSISPIPANGLSYGSYFAGQGYGTLSYGSAPQDQLLHVKLSFPSLTNITEITMNNTNFGAGGGAVLRRVYDQGGFSGTIISNSTRGTSISWTGSRAVSALWFNLVHDDISTRVYLTSVTIRGTGADPFP